MSGGAEINQVSNHAPSGPNPASQTKLIFQNVSVNYLVTGTELLLGIFMLPFNVAHLGQSAYGLWILVASVTVYFSMLDMGYGVAQVRFVAKYRAHGDTTALNEVTSTMFCIFSGVGLFTFILAILISLNLDRLFPLTDAQVRTGQVVLLCISAYVALGFPFSVFGGIVNGFQRQYMNGAVAFATAIVVAGVNIIVLLSGYGLAELVASTTAVRILSYFAYALNAYRVFPGLRSEEHTSELQSRLHLVCRLLLEKKNSPQPLRGTKGKRKGALFWYVSGHQF